MEASALRSQGDFKKAVAALGRALLISERFNLLHHRRLSLLRMGLLFWNLAKMPESSRYIDQAKTAFKEAGDIRAAQFCQNCLELIQLYEQGKKEREHKLYYVSIQMFDEAISLGRAAGIPDFELKCLRQKSLIYWEMDQLDSFLKMNEQGLKIAETINHHVEKGRFLNNIGIVYHRQNNYSLAVEYLENALSCIRTTGDTATEAECLSNLGILYRDLGNYSRALLFLTRALDLDRKMGDPESISADLGNIGTVFLRKGVDTREERDFRKSLEAFQGSLASRGSAAWRAGTGFTALNNIGVILNELGRPEEARFHFEAALKEARDETYALEKGYLLNNIATSYLYEGRTKESRRLYEMSYRLGVEKSLEDVVIESCFGLGRCFELERSFSEALDYYQQSASALENIRDRLSSEILTVGFNRNKLGVFQKIVDILTFEHQSRPSPDLLERIFDAIERAKARAFLENICLANRGNLQGDQLRFKKRLELLSRNIQELGGKLAKRDLPDAEKALIDIELEREEDEFLRLSLEAKANRMGGAEKVLRDVCSVKDIQSQVLNNNEMLLQYHLGTKRSVLLLVTASSIELFTLPGRIEIERSLRAYIKMVSEKMASSQDSQKASERIAQELLPFISRNRLRGVTRLIVIPDGILHYLPFETLRTVSANGTRYLIEDYALSYCPSASSLLALRALRRKEPPMKDLLAIGAPGSLRRTDRSKKTALLKEDSGYLSYRGGVSDLPYLPFSRDEVVEVAKMFPKKRTLVLFGEAASEDVVKALPLEEFRIIHLACHGLLDEAHPFRSALVLSSESNGEEDGFLQMREIYGLSTNADIVVLSACQTARGRLELAEGVMGLARPFFFIGARSILASMWAVNDKAAVIFMREFYRHLCDGRAAADALRLAKMKFLKSPRSQSFYWASFILIGDHEVAISGQ